MTKKILIAYATRTGTTMEIADSIGKVIAESGAGVDVRPIKAVTSIDGYGAVIIGSPVRAGQLMGEVIAFAKKNRQGLQKVPVAAFVVCLTMKDDTPENRQIVNGYLDPLRKEIAISDAGLFAGKMDFSKLNFFLKFVVKNMVKSPEGDFRDWKKIKEWAGELSKKQWFK